MSYMVLCVCCYKIVLEAQLTQLLQSLFFGAFFKQQLQNTFRFFLFYAC